MRCRTPRCKKEACECTALCRGVDVGVTTGGVGVTLIDFTLSRLRTPSGDIQFCNLAADPALFQGPKGDCQVCSCMCMRLCMHPATDSVQLD